MSQDTPSHPNQLLIDAELDAEAFGADTCVRKHPQVEKRKAVVIGRGMSEEDKAKVLAHL